MKAAHISKLNGPDAVEIVDVEAPEPDAGQVLIEVHAAGVSFPEVLQTRGRYQVKPDLPFIPGAEVGGVIVQAPPTSGLKPGDRVAALSFLAGFAEYAVADAETTFKIPDSMTFEQAAAVPFNYLTA
ncbi:alcohol dehydrogenase catalytic domain-containing protein, partial [Saccharopolyspora shandongensis]|uniref:alcohol dehydrogenase catalytic domain-containing protein n=1 Tax=Saccharopolyspora shandongensis TaxID=418495 RepID=UPI0033F8195B